MAPASRGSLSSVVNRDHLLDIRFIRSEFDAESRASSMPRSDRGFIQQPPRLPQPAYPGKLAPQSRDVAVRQRIGTLVCFRTPCCQHNNAGDRSCRRLFPSHRKSLRRCSLNRNALSSSLLISSQFRRLSKQALMLYGDEKQPNTTSDRSIKGCAQSVTSA